MNNWDDWARELSEFLDSTTRMTEQWAEQTLKTAVDAADTLADELEKQIGPTLEEWADEFQQTMTPLENRLDEEIGRFSEEFTEVMTPVIVPLVDALDSWLETIATPLNQTLDPIVNEHPPCIGCRHYYGQTHGGNMLVCAMYPYGPETEKCPDWESVWHPPSNNG
ncbi:MAG: hypothetical protein F6J95_010455 [Leptolyngbya sp. SIO1E4]|nr:hypothetical protein [Leptolyngbya sp. SIO1E4]